MKAPVRPPIPPVDLGLAFAGVAPLPVLAVIAFALPVERAVLPVALAQLWGAAILVFLAGVARGLSFRGEGGARPIRIVTMGWLFVLGLGGLALPPPLALPVLLVGYGSAALLDPPAARRGEAPAYFARLRPGQMALAIAGLLGLIARVWIG